MPRPDTDLITRDLRSDEGMRLSPYYDSRDQLTIGIGHCLDTNPMTPAQVALVGHDGRDDPITQEQAYSILADDLECTYELLDSHAAWWADLDEVRARVIAEMCFNMGWGNGAHGLSSFVHTLYYFKSGNYAAASAGMLASGWASQVGARANRLARMVASGKDIAPGA